MKDCKLSDALGRIGRAQTAQLLVHKLVPPVTGVYSLASLLPILGRIWFVTIVTKVLLIHV